ncbi:MAG: aminopeptidase P N-terminal domain-containing protein [Pseudomonadales bacterium]|nr:aminopeptidase P N-terminal domain-containing protein [Pseudomonadales bacterium]MCP5183389.1 aminopeptidase P N-terminal domain-containing protein [Pseudomonadales bacterium]
MSIPLAEFRRRRQRLMELMQPGSLAVIPGGQRKIRNRDVEYPFRQDSDFYYLTGFTEDNALLVLVPGRSHGEAILFCQEREKRFETYHGERLGPDRAVDALGVDDAFPFQDMGDILPGLLEGKERIYMTLGDHPDMDRRLLQWVGAIRGRESGGAIAPGEFVAAKHMLHELRLFKSARELSLMRRAAEITIAAHKRAMRASRTALTELALEAELLHAFMQEGARWPAYESIVGSGNNGCTLHYTANNGRLRKGDLVLIDAGCEFDYYASDLTRTFPVDGRFRPAQKALYEIVLAAQTAAIERCTRQHHFNDPHEAATEVMVDGLRQLKLLKGSRDEILEKGTYHRFCPHKASHWLGLDVHDVGDYRLGGEWRELEPGMVLTVEPGIYIRDDDSNADIPAKWRGIGIRIEDDVLITRGAPEVLTAAAPKTVADIEAWMAG